MVKLRARFALGSLLVVAVALFATAVWLWLHNVIIAAAPVAFLAAGCGWAGIDNALIYPKERARRQATEPPAAPDQTPTPPAIDPHEVSAPY